MKPAMQRPSVQEQENQQVIIPVVRPLRPPTERSLLYCSPCGDLFKHPVTGIFVSLHLQSWKKPSKEVLLSFRERDNLEII